MSQETKIVYYIGDEQTPYMKKINISPDAVTLADFKSAISKSNYKFFFKSKDQDFGYVSVPVCYLNDIAELYITVFTILYV